ncbi:prepilin-type N-terminal cleavage/methylation domain-containing protein [Chloroflexota bacterium]
MRWLEISKLKLLLGQKGFTLLEVLIAAGIVGVIGTVILLSIDTSYRADRTLDEKVVASNLITAHMEAIRSIPFDDAYSTAGGNITIPNQYSVVIDTECSSDGDNFVPCTGSENETFQWIRVSVSREGRPVLSACTFRTKI